MSNDTDERGYRPVLNQGHRYVQHDKDGKPEFSTCTRPSQVETDVLERDTTLVVWGARGVDLRVRWDYSSNAAEVLVGVPKGSVDGISLKPCPLWPWKANPPPIIKTNRSYGGDREWWLSSWALTDFNPGNSAKPALGALLEKTRLTPLQFLINEAEALAVLFSVPAAVNKGSFDNAWIVSGEHPHDECTQVRWLGTDNVPAEPFGRWHVDSWIGAEAESTMISGRRFTCASVIVRLFDGRYALIETAESGFGRSDMTGAAKVTHTPGELLEYLRRSEKRNDAGLHKIRRDFAPRLDTFLDTASPRVKQEPAKLTAADFDFDSVDAAFAEAEKA